MEAAFKLGKGSRLGYLEAIARKAYTAMNGPLKVTLFFFPLLCDFWDVSSPAKDKPEPLAMKAWDPTGPPGNTHSF